MQFELGLLREVSDQYVYWQRQSNLSCYFSGIAFDARRRLIVDA